MKTGSVLALLYLLSVPALGQASTLAQKEEKVKIKGIQVVIKDKSKPIRRELEERYARLAESIEMNDIDAILSFRTADFSATDFQGRKLTTEFMAARSRLMVQQIQPPIRASNTLGLIDVKGDEAVVTVRQFFSRMQMVASKLRKVETSVTQDETWLRTPEGWKLRFVQNVRDMEWYVDGKRIEPGKPYDPSAPPYEPKLTKPGDK